MVSKLFLDTFASIWTKSVMPGLYYVFWYRQELCSETRLFCHHDDENAGTSPHAADDVLIHRLHHVMVLDHPTKLVSNRWTYFDLLEGYFVPQRTTDGFLCMAAHNHFIPVYLWSKRSINQMRELQYFVGSWSGYLDLLHFPTFGKYSRRFKTRIFWTDFHR